MIIKYKLSLLVMLLFTLLNEAHAEEGCVRQNTSESAFLRSENLSINTDEPVKDLNERIEKGDYRFLSARQFTTFHPGLISEEDSKLICLAGTRLIDDTGDALVSSSIFSTSREEYETYAFIYNRALRKYLKSDEFEQKNARKTIEPNLSESQFVNGDEFELLLTHNTKDPEARLNYLLLAIEKSRLSTDIGRVSVKYASRKGISYWKKKLKKKNPSVEVLVNSALYLLSRKANDKESEAEAIKLLTKAAEKNYWPAMYYVAEYYFNTHIVKEYMESQGMVGAHNPELSEVTKNTDEYFHLCNRNVFVPCFYRTGILAIRSPQSAKWGLVMLDLAVERTIGVKDYENYFKEGSLKQVSRVIAKLGEKYGLDPKVVDRHKALSGGGH